MGIFNRKDEQETENLPTTIFLNPTIKLLEGFKDDIGILQPIIRLTKYMRDKFAVSKGDHIVLKKDDRLVKVKVDVSSVSDGIGEVARLNPAARDLLSANIGDEIEVIPPESLILLIDTSGSMGDYISGIMKTEATKDAVKEFIRNKFLMGHDDKIGIISFGQFATVVEKLSNNYERLENRTATLMPNGATAMHEGVSLSIDLLSSPGGAKRIVLLTDGIPTTTGRMSIIALAKKAASKHIVIDTVGVGSPFDFMGYDEGLLRKIAAVTGGTFRRVLDIKELSGQFRELAEGKNYSHLLPEK
ncbi:MAG TPA: VWA domain-containing protein [Spirochaetes bacterium]|nr:VWA domain-containing protein [Spirochaetota bacterium]